MSASESDCRFTAFVGRTSAPRIYAVEAGHVRCFAEAIGDENPIYFDAAAARAAGYAKIPAPPTFAIALRAHDPRDGLDIDWKRLLHGEQEFEYRRPLFVGDRVTVVGKIAAAYAKSGKAGMMDMLQLETTGSDDDGETIFVTRSLVVIKR